MAVPDPPLSVQAIVMELEALVDPSASPTALSASPVVRQLSFIADVLEERASSEVPGAVARALLNEVAQGMPSAQHPEWAHDDVPLRVGDGLAVAALLGLTEGTANSPITDRETRAAQHLSITRDAFKKRASGHAQRLLARYAEALLEQEGQHRLRKIRRSQAQRRLPEHTRLGIRWVERFETYYRIWGPATGILNEVNLALLHPAGQARHEEAVLNSFYFMGLYDHRLERFDREQGALWILPSAAADQAVADSAWQIGKSCPLPLVDRSYLRGLFREYEELDPFHEQLKTDQRLKDLFKVWRNWLNQECACDERVRQFNWAHLGMYPNPDLLATACEPHRMIAACHTIYVTLEIEWRRLSDFYIDDSPPSQVQPFAQLLK
jgi:hypothetical protein